MILLPGHWAKEQGTMINNNKELQELFVTAESGAETIFDVYDFLTDYEEDYVSSGLVVAKVKPTIYDAYELYRNTKSNAEKAVDKILNADFSKIIEQFDLEKLFNQIPEEYRGVIAQLLEEMGLNE